MLPVSTIYLLLILGWAPQLISTMFNMYYCAFRHLLVVFGGLKGLETSLESDENLQANDPSLVFDHYVNTCPGQGSGTIRTEEAILVTMSALRPIIAKATHWISTLWCEMCGGGKPYPSFPILSPLQLGRRSVSFYLIKVHCPCTKTASDPCLSFKKGKHKQSWQNLSLQVIVISCFS